MWLLCLSDLLALFMQHNEICKHRVKDPFLALACTLFQFRKGLKINIWGSGVGTQKGKNTVLKNCTRKQHKLKLFLFPVSPFHNTFVSIT